MQPNRKDAIKAELPSYSALLFGVSRVKCLVVSVYVLRDLFNSYCRKPTESNEVLERLYTGSQKPLQGRAIIRPGLS